MAMLHSPSEFVSRRTFLAGVAATAVLAACGSGSDDDTASTSAGGDGPTIEPGTYTLAQRFPQDVQEPGLLRLPVSLAGAGGALLSDGPATLGAQVTDLDGAPIGERFTAVRRDLEGGAYYAFRTTVDTPGFYYLVVDGGPAEGAAFQVMEPGTVAVPGRGQPLPPFDTPTIDDARGVDPLCTRQPDICPFHEITLTEALATGKQVVYLIGTPAFCQTGTCAPALESIIDVNDAYADRYVFVHAEVYTDDTASVQAPAVDAANLRFEPVLFITDADGTVVERLDAIWNESELVEVLDAASA
ncbi:MAG: twin-arginine translocation signal domain-containing protein [Ilumatobacteraceae bacterium]